MTVLVSILGLAVLILIHEAGHFFTALAVGIRPRKFYIGFPPPLAKITRNGIEYGIGAIPLGGYVRIPGMHRPAAKDLDLNFSAAVREAPELQPLVETVERHLDADDRTAAQAAVGPLRAAVEAAQLSRLARKTAERGLRDLEEGLGGDAYWRQPIWKRIAVIFAGPATNIVFAIGLLALVYAIGAPTNDASRKVGEVQGGRPAATAGLRAGDEIVAVDGRPTPTFEAIRRRISASHGRPITVTVLRHGRTVTLGPARTVKAGDRWVFGFVPSPVLRSYPVGTAFGKALDDCWLATKGMGLAIAGLFDQHGRGQLTSTVGIVRVSSEALKVSFRIYLEILGFISLSLALLNLLPLLPLDGGHILFTIIEGIRRRAVAREVYERASVIGFAVILMIAFIALSNDLGGKRPG